MTDTAPTRRKRTSSNRRTSDSEEGRAKSASLFSRAHGLATLSHEIRTPLNGVLGMANLLAETPLDETQRAYLSALRTSGEHLLGLVNDVLDLAKLESGLIDLQLRPLALEDLFQGVTELLATRAHEAGLDIAWAVDRDAPTILADAGRLKQVLFNLAGNAVKMTAARGCGGGVLIAGRVRPAGGRRVRLRLSVRDTGPGVPDDVAARLFEEFYQAEEGAAAGGAGLGLAIVRRIAAAMDAEVGIVNHRIDADSYWGAEFWIEAEFDIAEPGALTRRGKSGPLSGRTIAVISSSPVVREAALAQIRASGARAVLASGFEALDPCYDAVLVDPGARAPSRAVRPPKGVAAFILLTAEGRDQIEPYRKAGYQGYLIKPLRRASIISRLHAVLGVQPDPEVLSPMIEDERGGRPKATSGLRILLAEDNAVNALLAKALLKRLGCVVTHADTGDSALAAASTETFDLVLMDVRMPVLDGMEVTRRLRAKGFSSPIIAVTANAFEDDRAACLAAGMDEFLTKPIQPVALNALIAKIAQDR